MREWTPDEHGRLASLAQQGWRVDYSYRGDGREDARDDPGKNPRGLALPARLTLRGEGVVVRIAIRDWRVP